MCRVRLEGFEGHLDDLLFRIRKRQLEILEISLTAIVKQYLEYLRAMENLDLGLAGDFLVITASLMYIKSKRLLPKEENEDEEAEEEAPPDLGLALLEYQKIKEAADLLLSQNILGRDVFTIGVGEETTEKEEVAYDPEDLDLFHLARAFFQLMEGFGPEPYLLVEPEGLRVTDKIEEIRRLLQPEKGLTFQELLPSPYSRAELIVTFLALLELVRQRAILIVQPELWGHILIFPARRETKWFKEN